MLTGDGMLVSGVDCTLVIVLWNGDAAAGMLQLGPKLIGSGLAKTGCVSGYEGGCRLQGGVVCRFAARRWCTIEGSSS